MEKTIKEKLDSMVGKTYDTGDRVATVEKWKFLDPNFIIITSARSYVFGPKEVEAEIKLWEEFSAQKPVNPRPVVNTLKKEKTDENTEDENKLPVTIQVPDLYDSNNTYSKVQDKLMEMMESISDPKASKETLDKANAACNVASTMIALERLNLQVKKSNERALLKSKK